MQTVRAPQIGVMGSAADLGYGNSSRQLATEVGQELAKRGTTTIFGAEKDVDSLSTMAARAARSAGGRTVGITYGAGLKIYDEIADVVIATGLARGGGREFTLALSCDAVITVGGGSGTLNEIAVAYQAGIPIVALATSSGWSERLAGTFLDERRKVCIQPARTAREAVELALRSVSVAVKRNRGT